MFNLKNRLIEKLNEIVDARIEAKLEPARIDYEKNEHDRLCKELEFRHHMNKHADQVEGYLKGFNKLLTQLLEKD